MRDAALGVVLTATWLAEYAAHAKRKFWNVARRGSHDIRREQTLRTMRQLGIRGASRAKLPVS